MKKLLSVLTSLVVLFFASAFVSAQDVSPSPFRVKKEKVENRVERAKEIRGQRAEGLQVRKENLSRYVQKLVARLGAMVQRLEILIVRIESRIEKISTEFPEQDLSATKKDVAKAKTTLISAKEKIAELESLGDGLSDTEEPKVVFKELKTKLESIKKDLKETHRLLVHAIGEIKGLRVGELKNDVQ